MIQYSQKNKVKRISFLPFIPRGSGNENRGTYELSYNERYKLRDLIRQRRKEFNGIIDIRLLDFNVKQVPVVEPDGRVVMECSTEVKDILLYHIPSDNTSEGQS